MPLDSNIPLQVQPVQIQNPLDTMIKGLSLKQLAGQTQIQDRAIADDQSVRDAFKNNTSIDPTTGQMKVNRPGALSQLASTAPQKAMDYQKLFQGQDMDQLKATTTAAKDLAWSVSDENSYQAARAKAIQMNLPNAQQLPQQYMPNFVQNWQMHTLEGEKQIDVMNKQKEMGIQQQVADAKTKEANTGAQNASVGKQNSNYQKAVSLLEQVSKSPAAAQAEKDLYATAKVDSMVNLKGDPNKLDNQQVQLVASEVAKIASGGVPTNEELKGLNPATLPSKLAGLAQTVLNEPTPANKGAFVKSMQDYTNSLKTDAQKVINDRYGRIVESNKRLVGPDNYQTLQDQYVNRFKNLSSGNQGGGPMSFDDFMKSRSSK